MYLNAFVLSHPMQSYPYLYQLPGCIRPTTKQNILPRDVINGSAWKR